MNNNNDNLEIENLVSEMQENGVRMKDQSYYSIDLKRLHKINDDSKELFKVVDQSLAKSKENDNKSIFDLFKSPHEQRYEEYEIIDFLIGCVFRYKNKKEEKKKNKEEKKKDEEEKDFLSYAQDRIKRLSGDGLDSDIYLDDLLEKAKPSEDDESEEHASNEGEIESEADLDVDEGEEGEKLSSLDEEPDLVESIPDPDAEEAMVAERDECLVKLFSDYPRASAFIKKLKPHIQIILALTCQKESIKRIKEELELKNIFKKPKEIKELQTIIIEELRYKLRSKTIDLNLPNRVYWSTTNVGTDLIEEPGDRFAWAETRKKSRFDKNSYTYDKAVWNGIWGDGWFVPTIEQWRELLEYKEKRWEYCNDVKGIRFTAPDGFSLFLPVGKYWSASSNDTETALSVELNEQGIVEEKDQPRYLGLSIRLVRFDI